MTDGAMTLQLIPKEIELSNIYLDPNNPRFTTTARAYVESARISEVSVQEEAQQLLVRNFGVEKLRMSMEINGYLPIDRIIVREFSKDKFVVLEGNRRICAAKMISGVAMDGSLVDETVKESLAKIPCLLYIGTKTDAAWIFQGLRHISGIQEWSAYNKARLLVETMETEELSLTDVGKRFGLTPFGAGQWARF